MCESETRMTPENVVLMMVWDTSYMLKYSFAASFFYYFWIDLFQKNLKTVQH